MGESCSSSLPVPQRGFGQVPPGHEGQHRRGGGDQENPAPADQGSDQQAHHGRQTHSQRLAGLQEGSGAAAHVRGRSFLQQGVAHRPFAAHAQPGQQAEHQQAQRADGEGAQRGAQRVQPDGPGHHALAPVAIRQVAEQDSPDSRGAQGDPQQSPLPAARLASGLARSGSAGTKTESDRRSQTSSPRRR